MKVLVLGGTGAIGMHLVAHLTNSGVETYVTTRSFRKSKGKLHYVHGNAHDMTFLKSLLADDWDAVVDFMIYSTSSFQDRVELLLDSTRQYVYLSSARVYSDPEEPISEDTPRLLDVTPDKKFLLTDEYSLTKARQEDILKNSGKSNWTIVRPYITYAENRLQLGVLEKEGWLYRALQGRTIVFSEELCAKITTLTHAADVAKAMQMLLGNEQVMGDVFHIASSESLSWNAVLSIYMEVLERHLGYKPKVLLQKMNDFLKVHPAKYQLYYDRLYNRHFDNSKISHYYPGGYRLVEKGLRESLEKFLRNPQFREINWRMEALKDRSSNEFTSLKEIVGLKNKIKYLLYRYLI